MVAVRLRLAVLAQVGELPASAIRPYMSSSWAAIRAPRQRRTASLNVLATDGRSRRASPPLCAVTEPACVDARAAPNRALCGLRISYPGVPEIALGVELLDLVQLDVGVLRAGSGAAGDPPVGAGQAGGQVGTSSGP